MSIETLSSVSSTLRTTSFSSSMRRRSASNMKPSLASSSFDVAPRSAQRSKSLGVTSPSLPLNMPVLLLRCLKDFITFTSSFECEGGQPQRRSKMTVISFSGMSAMWISTKRLRKARERGFLPPYAPAGFWVANSLKFGCGLTTSLISARYNSLLSSRRRFRASSTSLGARFSSSSITQ